MGLYSATLPTVIDTIVRAVGTAELSVAAGGHHASFSAHWFYGTDPATGELFQQLDTGHGGWGATAGADGAGPYKTMAHGDTLDVPVIDESCQVTRSISRARRTWRCPCRRRCRAW